MDRLLSNKVFNFFKQLSSVPHGSDNTKQISDLCCRFASERRLEYLQDEYNNVIIYKSASKGNEGHEPVIIQGHLDMIAVKEADCDIDLQNDGLRLCTDGSFLFAEGTSLGADDGIAIAMALAVLDSDDIAHPPIEAVFTTNEETAMDGAAGLDVSKLKSRRMLNIDSEEEGVITCGCAGGLRVYGDFPLKAQKMLTQAVKISISGLRGGHSGSEIDKGRANAIKLMGRVLNRLSAEFDISIIELKGGEKDNAIANSAEAIISAADTAGVAAAVSKLENEIKNEYSALEPELSISCTELGENEYYVADKKCSDELVFALYQCPNGVRAMSSAIPGLVQTSLNLGTASTKNDTVHLTFCLRSSISSQKRELEYKLKSLIEHCGGAFTASGEYPAWEYREHSEIRDIACAAFEELFGKKPEISVIHAGLECGLFTDKMPGLDCISFGPDILDIHTTDEKLDIASAKRVYKLLVEILKRL